MNKFQFGRFSENGEVVFSADNNYTNPSSEAETRKQLSYPVATLKDYVNQTVSVQQVTNDDDIAVQLVVTTDNQLKFRTDESAQLQDLTIGQSSAFSFVGMVVSGTNLFTEADLKAIYGSSTSWSNLSSVLVTDGHVYGNGKALGLTIGTEGGEVSLRAQGTGLSPGDRYGQDVGTTQGNQKSTTGTLGVPTKTQAGEHPDYTGLIVETASKSVYTWERTV